MSNAVSGYGFLTTIGKGELLSGNLYGTEPLRQYVKAGTNEANPNWKTESNQPIIFPRIKAQGADKRIPITGGSEEWTYNGAVLSFDANGVSIAPKLFKKVTHDDGGILVPALRIIDNLASITRIKPDTIGFNCKVNAGGSQHPVYLTIDIRLEETSGDAYDSYIEASEGGVIDNDTNKIVCTAHLRKGGSKITEGVTYKWWVMGEKDYTEIPSDTNNPDKKTFTEGDIQSELVVKVEFYIKGKRVSQTSRQLSDETDPLILNRGPNGSETLVQGENESITYTPSVMKRGTGEVVTGFKFRYVLVDAMSKSIRTEEGTSLTLTYEEVDQYNGIGIHFYAYK